MKKTFLGLCFYLLNTFTVFAERGDHGRDYAVRDDSPFISPMELFGGIILIVCFYWILRGLLSIPDYLRKTFSSKDTKQPTTTNKRAENYRKKYTDSYRSMNYSEKSTIERREKQAKKTSIKETVNSQKRQFDKNPSSKLAMEIMDNYRRLNDYQNIKIWEGKAKVEKENEEKKEQEKKRKEMENEIEKLEPIFEDNPDSDIAPKLLNLYLNTRNLKGIIYFYKTRERHSLSPILEDIENVIPNDYFLYNLKKIARRGEYNNSEREAKMFADLKELASLRLYYKNHIQVMTNLSFCYACGIGTEKDIQKAIQIIEEVRDYKLKQLSNEEIQGHKVSSFYSQSTSSKNSYSNKFSFFQSDFLK